MLFGAGLPVALGLGAAEELETNNRRRRKKPGLRARSVLSAKAHGYEFLVRGRHDRRREELDKGDGRGRAEAGRVVAEVA